MPALDNPPKHLQMDRLDQISALPLGSRIAVDPWSDRIEMLKRQRGIVSMATQKMAFTTGIDQIYGRARSHSRSAMHEATHAGVF